MINAFYFMLKIIFVLMIFEFCLDLFGRLENSSIRKIRLISKFLVSQNGKQIIAMHMLPNVSKMATECMLLLKMLFLKKHTCGREASPRPFYKRSKLSIFLDHQPEVLYRNVIRKCYVQVKAFQNILTTCFYLI